MHQLRNVSSATKKTSVSLATSLINTNAEDANPRYFVDLRTAQVSRGKRANGDRYIEIQDRNDEIVQVAFEDAEDFKRWGIIFVESIKSDEILRQAQIIDPLRAKLAKQKQIDEATELESRLSIVKTERRETIRVSKQVYLGCFNKKKRRSEAGEAQASQQYEWDEQTKQLALAQLE